MPTLNDPTDLIGQIYDAALAPQGWSEVLHGLCRYVGGAAAMIFEHDSTYLQGRRLRSWGDDPYYTDLYFSRYLEINPSSRPHGLLPEGLAVSISGLVGKDVLLQSPFYHEWMRPQGYVDNVFANLHRSATRQSTVAVARSTGDGLVTPAALARMQEIVPHIRRAIRIGNLIEVAEAETVLLRKLIESLSAHVFLVDEAGNMSKLPSRNDDGLPDCDLVWKLTEDRYRMDRRLELEFAGFTVRMTNGTALPGGRHDVVISSGPGMECLARFLWLGQSSAGRSPVAPPIAAIFLHPAHFNAKAALDLITQRHNLTAREADIVRSLIGADTVADAASLEGIGTSTARSHLHSVFAKTGTAHQADLTRLLASLLLPL
ncbi:MAG: hypothetical protein ABI832_02640 [bacterium]